MPNPERLFAPLHLGLCQDVFSYLKTRCCLFCWCASYIWSCFFYLYLFAELLAEWRDDVRAEKLLSSAAKIVFLIMHQLRLYTGLMTNSTSYLLLVDFLFIGIGENQSEEVDLQACRPSYSSRGKSSTSPPSRFYLRISLVESSACASTWQLVSHREGRVVRWVLSTYLYAF